MSDFKDNMMKAHQSNIDLSSLKPQEYYHSLSINIVPARVESTPMPPQILIVNTINMKAEKFVNFKDELSSKATTVAPATTKERFCVTNHNCKTCHKRKQTQLLLERHLELCNQGIMNLLEFKRKDEVPHWIDMDKLSNI